MNQEKICKTGWVDRKYGICHRGVLSLKKGESCSIDSDCPTNAGLYYAKCKAGFTTGGAKYCDIEGGDREWIEARNAVIL